MNDPSEPQKKETRIRGSQAEWPLLEACPVPLGWWSNLIESAGINCVLQEADMYQWLNHVLSVRYDFIQYHVKLQKHRPTKGEVSAVLLAAEKFRALLPAVTPEPPHFTGFHAPTEKYLHEELYFRVDQFINQVKQKLTNMKSSAGAPPLDPGATAAVRGLVPAYAAIFGRQPSPKATGPAIRFVQAFFNEAAGVWTYRAPAPANNRSDINPKTFEEKVITFNINSPRATSIPHMLRRGIAAENDRKLLLITHGVPTRFIRAVGKKTVAHET